MAVILASSVLIFASMALTSKLHTAVDIIFSQVIISSLMITTVNWSYQSYLLWRVGSRESTVVCLFISSLGMAEYIVVLASYLSVAFMQLVIVKRGIQKFGRVFTRKIASAVSAGMWTVSIAASGVIVAGHYGDGSVYIYDPVMKVCHSHVPDSMLFNRTLSLGSTVWTFVCLIATFVCYMITIWALRSQVPSSHEARRSYGIEHLSSKTRRRLVTSVKKIIALMSMYMIALLAAGVITGLSTVSKTSELYVYQQFAYLLSKLGITAFFPVYILSHRLRRRACYLLLTGRYEDIKYTI